MGFLILDTDKQSTGSLRMQLGVIGHLRIHGVSDASEYAGLLLRRLPPPDVIFLDEDGEKEKVEAFRLELEAASPGPVVVYLGTDRRVRQRRSHDSYLRKPIFVRKLEKAMVQGYARGQERRFGVGYLGGPVPAELVRELPHTSDLWRQLFHLEANGIDPKLLAKMGVLFLIPPPASTPLRPEQWELIRRLYRFTSASRVLLVGVGNTPEQTHDFRNLADYFVPADADWISVLRGLARRRLHHLGSELGLRRARSLFDAGKIAAGERELRRILRVDPWNLAVRGCFAELAYSLGKYKSADAGYRRILELNPCQPRAYLRILEIERRLRGSHSEETLSRARSYCPKVTAIQEFG